MKQNILLPLVICFLASCSQYIIDDDGVSGGIDVYVKFQKNSGGDVVEIEYPVRIYAVDKAESSMTEFRYEEGDGIIASLPKGEYSINAFSGMDGGFVKSNDGDGTPIVTIKDNSSSHRPLMAAHASLNLKKQAEINLIPSYVVSSLEFEFENIPEQVRSIGVEISPVSCGYQLTGGFSDRTQNVVLECEASEGKWISGQRFIFPAEGKKTVVTVRLDYGDEAKTYSYSLVGGLKQGQPYKFAGGFGEGLTVDGDFQISGWNMEEEIIMDFDNDTPLEDGDGSGNDSNASDAEIFYVKSIPPPNVVWGPFYLWKVEETGTGTSRAVIISPDQWYQKFEKGEALEILNGYEKDGISGWRTFTKDEAKEFHKEFSSRLGELNAYLQENGLNIFYIGDEENRARYLCDNGENAFSIYGGTNIKAAGKTVKYYLRPLKTIILKEKK